MERYEFDGFRFAIVRDDGNIYLNLVNTGMLELERPRMMRVSFAVDNKEFSAPDWSVENDVLTLTTSAGTVRFRFQRNDLLRVRGDGRVCLRFHADEPRQFENACAREDGSVEAAFIILGKLLFVPLSGALRHDAMWQPRTARTDAYSVELLPSVETNAFGAAIHAYHSNGVRDAEYPVF